MDPKEAAKKLDGCEYGAEGSDEFFRAMRDAGLVAVFGYSDDNVEFRGAISEEVGAYDGTKVYLTRAGLLQNQCEDTACPYHAAQEGNAQTAGAFIDALWAEEEPFSWTYKTAIPHETFIVKEDGEPYCRGIVFRLADVPT